MVARQYFESFKGYGIVSADGGDAPFCAVARTQDGSLVFATARAAFSSREKVVRRRPGRRERAALRVAAIKWLRENGVAEAACVMASVEVVTVEGGKAMVAYDEWGYFHHHLG